MRYLSLCLLPLLLVLSSCEKNVQRIPDAVVVDQLPTFTTQPNEVEIADSMNDVDPTWVLGSIVNVKTGQVHGLDNYLAPDAKPVVAPQTEVVFKNLIENSVAMNAAYLDFIHWQINDTVRAELSVIKTSKVTMTTQDVQKEKLQHELQRIPEGERADYGVILGYVDFVLTASLFKDFGMEAGASGYGVKIGGSWFTKFGDTSAQHRVIAVWAPLPWVVNEVERKGAEETNLEIESLKAIKDKSLVMKQFTKPLKVGEYVQQKK